MRRAVSRSARGIFERKVDEEDVVGQIRTFLEAHGAVVFRIVERVPKCYRCGQWLGSSERGIPDIMGWFPPGCVANRTMAPKHFFIEVKAPRGGRKRLHQIAFVEKAQSHWVMACFAKSLKEARDYMAAGGLTLAEVK